MESIEDTILSSAAASNRCSQCTFKHVWISQVADLLPVKRTFCLHALHCSCSPSSSSSIETSLVIIHGTASTASSFASCFCHLHKHFSSIWALDLPGFGRSSVDGPAPKSSSESMEIFLMSMEMLILGGKIVSNQIVLMGHSFGTYVASNFALRHPSLVKKLVLVAPVGMLPTLGAKGFYWAFFFRDMLPLICDMACLEKKSHNDYWSQVLGHSNNSWGNRRAAGVGSFVYLSVLRGSSIWIDPVAHLLTEKQIPVSCIFAEKDSLVPTHQASSGALGCTCRIVKGAGHASILHGEYAEELCKVVVEEAMSNAGSLLLVPSTLDWKRFASSPVPSRTRAIIRRLYRRIIEERKGLCCSI